MIHRDIKPRNVLFDQTEMSRNPMGKPILTDFGFAKLLSAMAQTIGGTVLGMPLYLSPEQVQDKPVSSRSDLYSLGVMLSEVLVGVPPFQGASLSGTMMQHDLERPPASAALNPALPPNVAQVVLRSLAKDPLDRFPNASAMTVALAEAFELPVPEDLRPAPPAQLGGSCSAYHRADDCDWRVPKTQGRPSLNLWFGWADDGLPVHQGVDKPTPGQDARGNRGLGKSR